MRLVNPVRRSDFMKPLGARGRRRYRRRHVTRRYAMLATVGMMATIHLAIIGFYVILGA